MTALRPTIVGALLALSACSDPINLPPVKGPPLAAAIQTGIVPAKGEALKVAFVSPVGASNSRHLQITATFNKAMVSLSAVDKQSTQTPLTLDPPVSGVQRWLSSRTIALIADKPLVGSTVYKASVVAGLKALDGTSLATAKRWSFTTERLRVVRHYLPYNQRRWAQPSQPIKIYFNQPVSPSALARFAVFRTKAAATSPALAISARATHTSWNLRGKIDPRVVLLRPAQMLPLDAEVELAVAPGVIGKEGPLPTKAAYTTRFRTYGPFRLQRLDCTEACNPDWSPVLNLSNPANRSSVQAALRIDGKPLPRVRSRYATSRIYLPLTLAPRRSYTLSLVGPLVDQFGQALSGPRSISFKTGDYAPSASLALPSGVLERQGPSTLHLSFRNAKKAALHYKALQPEELVALLGRSSADNFRAQGGFRTQTLRVHGAPNTMVRTQLDAKQLLGGKGAGILALRLDYTLRRRVPLQAAAPRRGAQVPPPTAHDRLFSNDSTTRILRITNLGLTAKYSPHTTLLWLTSLDRGKPIGNATVQIFKAGKDKPLWSGKTDRNGLAVGPGTIKLESDPKAERSYIYLAQKGDDLTYALSTTQSGIRGWNFEIDETWEEGGASLLGLVFSDRGLYRPGQHVKLKGLLRQTVEKGLQVPSGKVSVQVIDARGENILTTKKDLSRFGSFDLNVPLPKSAPLGRYAVVAKLGPDGMVSGSFQVEEYRPAEFAVRVTPKHPTLVRGQTMAWRADARYLFGAPMRQAAYRTFVSWSNTSFTPPNNEGFAFGDRIPPNGTGPSAGQAARLAGRLSPGGTTDASQRIYPARMLGPRRYEIETSVEDVSRQAIAGRSSVLVHPAAFYIGAKTKETFVKAGDKVPVDVIAVTSGGKRLARASITGTLVKRSWEMVRQTGFGGRHRFVSRPKETPVGSCSLLSAAQPQRCTLTPPSAGYYLIRFAATDRTNNPVHSSIELYAAGTNYVAWKPTDEHRIEIVADRKSYKEGQTAKLLIKSPFARAHGLLTVERNGILLRRPLKLTSNATWVDLPISEAMAPNAFVSVVLVRGRVQPPKSKRLPRAKVQRSGEEDPGRPIIKVGYHKLSIDQSAKRLAVKVKTDRTSYEPGQEVTLSISTRDHSGRGQAAEITVIVADEGVLSLTGYRAPDPMTTFYAERGLSVRTADNRIALIGRQLLGPKGGNPGGGGGGHGGSNSGGARSRFVATPYFNPSLITDAQGNATARFRLPDNLTRFVVMAVAAGERSRFGAGRTSFNVRKPLLLTATLPRHLRVNDSIEAGVVVHNHSGKSGTVEVEVHAEGLLVDGAQRQRVEVAAGAAVETRFHFRAAGPGIARLRFSATMGSLRDALIQSRPVRVPLMKEVVATTGSTEGVAAEALAPGDDLRKDVGGLELTLASTALVGLRGSMAYLLDYPYECLEQTVSRLVPLVLLSELSASFGLADASKSKPLIARLIARAQQLQRYNGGFSLWPTSSQISPWVSAYATWGLLQAKRLGYVVSDRVLKQGAGYLRRVLKEALPKDTLEQRSGLATRAFAARVLAETGAVPVAQLNTLYERRGDLPLFGKIQLLLAMHHGKADRTSQKVLQDEIVGQVHQTGRTAKVEVAFGEYAQLFASSTRSTAMLLEALLQTSPKHVLVEKLVAQLLDSQQNGRWRNTQETVYALMGLHSYFKLREKVIPSFDAKVSLGKKWLLRHHFEGRSLQTRRETIPMARIHGLKAALGFHRSGTGRLYYSARLTYARTTLPDSAWDQGFFITRRYDRVAGALDGNAANASEQQPISTVRAGSLVRVSLRIIVPQTMHYVLVDDPLPAGLEPVNFNLMTATRAHRRYRSSRGRSPYGATLTPFYHRELRDDRVVLFADKVTPGVYTYSYLARATTLGHFVAPPARAEQMYAPEVFGRTAASHFTITAP